MSRRREYLYRAELNPRYILEVKRTILDHYIVTVRYSTTDRSYLLYGPYKHLGTASNRIRESAARYKTNPVKYYYAPKYMIDYKCIA